MLNIKNAAMETVIIKHIATTKVALAHACTDCRRSGRGDLVRKGKPGIQDMHLTFV